MNLKTGNKLKKKYLYSYVFVYCMILAVLCFFALSYTAFDISRKNSQTYQGYAKMVSDRIDEKLSTVEAFISQLSQTQWVNRIIYMQGNQIDYERISYLTLCRKVDSDS